MDEQEPNKWASRKFAFAITLLILPTVLLIFGYIKEGVYADIIQATIFGYLAAQASIDLVKRR